MASINLRKLISVPLTAVGIVAALGYTPASSGAVVMADGSAGSPGMFFGLEPGTGFYRPDTGMLSVAAAGVEQVRFIGQIAPHASQPAPQRTGVSAFMVGREIGGGIKGSQLLVNCVDSFVDFEVRSSGLNPDYVEFRLGTGTGTGNLSFVALSYRESTKVALLECWSPPGSPSGIDVSTKPQDFTSNAFINLGRSTETSGAFSVYIHKGDGTNTPNYAFQGKTSGYLQIDNGMLGVGMGSGAAATLHVFDDRGAVTNEIIRLSHSDKALGWSVGVNDGGTTNTYVRHIYDGSPDAAFNIVFGANFTGNIAATFFKDKRAKFFGKGWFADDTVIGSSSVSAGAKLHIVSAGAQLKVSGTGDPTLGALLKFSESASTKVSVENNYANGNAAVALVANGADRLSVYGTGKVELGSTGFIAGFEITAPTFAPANGFYWYCDDNGSGKSRLNVRFQTGAPIVIAQEA